MTIKNVKITMSRIGITSANSQKATYMPIAKIDYIEKENKSQTIHLDDAFIPDKKYFKGVIIGSSYFIGITKDSYQIYDKNGNRTGTANIEQFGNPIQTNEDDFVCLKGKIASLIGSDGECKKSRELTNEEYKAITQE
jgi:DNA/RNA endonuclease YhcR with UshA esterase domain